MWRFLRGLFSGVARGLGWAARMALGLACDVVEGVWTALWRQLFPPPAEEAETTAEVIERMVDVLAERDARIEQRAVIERPSPRQASPAAMRRSMEAALAYTAAYVRGETLPSLTGVHASLCHELRQVTSRAQAATLHRDIADALGIDDQAEPVAVREVLAPAQDHDATPHLRYA